MPLFFWYANFFCKNLNFFVFSLANLYIYDMIVLERKEKL